MTKKMSLCCVMGIAFVALILIAITSQDCLAAYFQYDTPNPFITGYSDPAGGRVDIALSQLSSGGTGGTWGLSYQLQGSGTSHDSDSWISLGSGSGGVDLYGLQSGFQLGLRVTSGNVTYALGGSHAQVSIDPNARDVVNIRWDTNNNGSFGAGDKALTVGFATAAVPIPPSALLLGSGLLGLVGVGLRRQRLAG
jgi:hypothetical protein